MSKIKSLVEDQFNKTGIKINGSGPADPQIHNDRAYSRIFFNGSLGIGESYMDGDWDCEDLAELVSRVLKSGEDIQFFGLQNLFLWLGQKIYNDQTIRRSRRVAKQHYDLGNDLYESMLGESMAYTCGYWKDAKNLDEAQWAKFKLICEKLNLQPGQRVLDIGSGFGSFAKYAAENYGVHVVGITLSAEQIDYANTLCKNTPHVEFRLMDYRNVTPDSLGMFDHVVSIGMFEHVGPKNYRTYMQVVKGILKPNGLFLLHTIGGKGIPPDPWIEKYIFPGGYLPSELQIIDSIKGLFLMEDWHNFGPNYDRTLSAWWENFNKAWPELKATGKYDDRFYRMWKFYLLSMAGAFRTRNTQLWQIVLSGNGVEGGYKSVR